MTFDRCPCGASRVLRGSCMALLAEPFGRTEITHRQVECPSCGRVEKWHDRERRLLGWRRCSSAPCNCGEFLSESFTERD